MSEMTINLLMHDKKLKPLYQEYLIAVKPHVALKAGEFYKNQPQ